MANKVNKIDFYVGAVLSQIITKIIHPAALFDYSNHSKSVTFETDKDKYNLFIKYSSKPNKSKNISETKWTYTFTKTEMDCIPKWYKNGYRNYIVFLCGKENLDKSEIAVVDCALAKKCLGNDTVNDSRNIVVRRKKSSHHFRIHGTALSDKDAIKIGRDIEKYIQ